MKHRTVYCVLNDIELDSLFIVLLLSLQQFLLLSMGMKGAISNNSCIWCLIHKKDRYYSK